jgi:hypothetical protein
MTSRNWSRKSIAFALAIAVLSVYSMVALANRDKRPPASCRSRARLPLMANPRFQVPLYFRTV